MIDFAEEDVKETFQLLIDGQRSWTITLPFVLRHQQHFVTGVGVCFGLGVLLQFQILQRPRTGTCLQAYHSYQIVPRLTHFVNCQHVFVVRLVKDLPGIHTNRGGEKCLHIVSGKTVCTFVHSTLIGFSPTL